MKGRPKQRIEGLPDYCCRPKRHFLQPLHVSQRLFRNSNAVNVPPQPRDLGDGERRLWQLLILVGKKILLSYGEAPTEAQFCHGGKCISFPHKEKRKKTSAVHASDFARMHSCFWSGLKQQYTLEWPATRRPKCISPARNDAHMHLHDPSSTYNGTRSILSHSGSCTRRCPRGTPQSISSANT